MTLYRSFADAMRAVEAELSAMAIYDHAPSVMRVCAAGYFVEGSAWVATLTRHPDGYSVGVQAGAVDPMIACMHPVGIIGQPDDTATDEGDDYTDWSMRQGEQGM